MVNARIVDLRRDAIDISRFMPPPVFAMMTIAGAHVSAAAGLVPRHLQTFRANLLSANRSCAHPADRDVVRRKTAPHASLRIRGAKLKNSDIVESTSGLGNERERQLRTDGALHHWPL